MLYADAASSTEKICAILFKGGQRERAIEFVAKDRTPSFWIKAFDKTNLIYGLELLAPLDFITNNVKLFMNSTINLYLGNNNAIASLVRGDSSSCIIAKNGFPILVHRAKIQY